MVLRICPKSVNFTFWPLFTLFSIFPIAANKVAFATELKVHPEKAALTVFLSTLFALFYIPLVVSLLF